MANLRCALSFKHRASLGDEVEEVNFAAGAEFIVLETWQSHYLVRDVEGRLFNVPKEQIELAPGEGVGQEKP